MLSVLDGVDTPSPPPVGVLPLGTGNDMSRDVHSIRVKFILKICRFLHIFSDINGSWVILVQVRFDKE